MRRIFLFFALWAGILGIARATTFTVSNTNNSGAGSLRQAILSANADASATAASLHQINFTVPNGSTITVISPFLVITNHISINGLGVANLTISGGGASRIFWVQNGTITIQNLTLANGYAKGGDGGGGGMGAGGAIFMHEGKEGGTGTIDLRLVNVNLNNNRAVGGNASGRDLVFGPSPGGGGLGGNGSTFLANPGIGDYYYGAGGGVLGNGDAGGGGSVTNAVGVTGGNNGGISIFGNGGNYVNLVFGSSGGFGGGGSAGTQAGHGGFGAGGGTGTQAGNGGFGGGGGNGTISGNGGFGGGGGRGLSNGSGGFGGGSPGSGWDSPGGGMGAGGAIFVTSGRLSLTGVNFTNNNATRGGSGSKGYEGAFFVFNKADNGGNAAPGTTNDPMVTMCNVSFNGNTADDNNSTYTNNDNVYASNVSSLSPTGYVSSNTSTICAGESIQLSFTLASGTGPFDIVVNGVTYNDVPSGSVFATLTEGTHFTGTGNFNLTQITDANNCVVSGLSQTTTGNVNTGGSISGSQAVCANGDPGTFNSTANGSGAGTITYRWERSTTNCNTGFSTIMNETGTTYDPPAGLTQTTYYRRVTMSTLNGLACEAISNCVTVIVNPAPVAATSAGTDVNNLCYNDGGSFSLTANGGSGTTFVWYAESCGGISIGSGTLLIIPVPTATTTYYGRWETPGCTPSACVQTTMNIITAPEAPTGAQSSDNNFCPNAGGNLTLTAFGGAGNHLEWFRGSCGNTPIGSGNNLVIAKPTATTMYYVRWSNSCGSSTCAQVVVTVTDAEAPTITCPANIAVNASPGQCSAVVTYTAPVGTDDCPGATTVQTAGLASGATFPVGITTNTFRVTDAAGNKTECSFTVTVTDNEAPTISCPANIAVNNTPGQCSAVVTYTAPVGSDNCPGASMIQIAGLASGATFPVGMTTNTFRVTDAAGNKTECSFTVTVTDNEAPSISCPANQTACEGSTVTFIAPVGSDNCPGANTIQTTGLPSGSGFPVGITTNTFRVTASNGQTAMCSFTVTIYPRPTATISGTASICQNAPAAITFTGSGGTAPYSFTYQINGGSNQTVTTMVGNSVTINPSTATAGVFTYTLLSVIDAHCGQNQSGTATLTIQAKPTISLNVLGQTLQEGNNPTLCDNDATPSNALQFNVTTGCIAGAVQWRTQVGAGGWSAWSATVPNSQPSDNVAYHYQAACDVNCPSSFTNPIVLTINYRASIPQNVSLVADGTTVAAGESKTICDVPGNTLTLNATCAAGEVLLYSVDGGDFSPSVPSQIVDGTFHNYRVRCGKADGTPSCVETESAVMSLKITTPSAAPTVTISPVSGCGTPVAFSGSSGCVGQTTLWYNATTDQLLPSLPSTTPTATTSYYARCQNTAGAGEAGCLSEKSNTVTYTVIPVNDPPMVTASADMVCAGTSVTISANCPAGSTAFWNTGVTTNSFQVAFNNVTTQTYWVKCIFPNGCQSSESTHKTVFWKAFELTLINIGQSQSGSKPANDRTLWASQFITADAGPSLDKSTQANPTIYHSEKVNKTAPRYWTIQVETCALGIDGSVTYDLLVTPEVGVPQSFNTHENNAPYLMYANREGFTELYAQNHPAYGFYQSNGSGGNTYDAGLPKGLYKLGIRYWDQKGQGSIYPSTRQPAGNVLAYQEYWFRIQSQNGVGSGASRTALNNDQLSMNNGQWVEVAPNPVSNVLRLKLSEAKGQKVSTHLTDASGRQLLQRGFVPQSDRHQEEFEVSHLANGIYFLQVKTGDKQTTLKVIKVQ